jgi:hypothetical protein
VDIGDIERVGAMRKRDDQKICRKAECSNNSASRDESISQAGSGHRVRTEAAYNSGKRVDVCGRALKG